MAAAEPPPPTGMGFLGLLSFRRSATAVASFDPAQDDELQVLDALQAHVADRLAAAAAGEAPILSLGFLSKLLDAVLSSDEAFREVLQIGPVAAALSRPPSDRLAADLLDRAVKALDVLNAVSLTLASLRGSHRAALAAASCLLLSPSPHAHFARARRAISRLFPTAAAAAAASPSPSHRAARALSFSVSSRNWSSSSGARHAVAAHLAPPPPQSPSAATAGAGCGLGLALYTMSSVLVFSTWALVAAVPCQERASAAGIPPVAPPKQLQWAAAMASLQERIAEEWRRKEKKGSSLTGSTTGGLLAEMQAMERAARELSCLLEEVAEEEEEDEVSEERARGVVQHAEALAAACRALEEGLAPLERQVRAVFHRVVASRGEVLRVMEHNARSSSAAAAAASGSGAPSHHHSF